MGTNSKEYSPSDFIKCVQSYLNEDEKLDRILYSEITNHVFSLNSKESGIFSTNVEKSLLYVLDENNNVDEDCRKIVIKIYDHFQLVSSQKENIGNIFSSGINDTKEIMIKEIKNVEKEYITILGIFASIVLTFVGTFTFSTSVLQNMHNVSMYRIMVVVLLIGGVSLNILYGLFYYIERIVKEKQHTVIPIVIMNITIAFLLLATVYLWNSGYIEERNNKINDISSNLIEYSFVESNNIAVVSDLTSCLK